MLTINVPGTEYWDEEKEEFLFTPETAIELEHSLVALSKWEEIFEKPFLSTTERTDEEAIGYLICMTLNEVPPGVYVRLSKENHEAIAEYINAKRTATWFSEQAGGKATGEILTAELIYYWMFSANIDISCQDWHLNKLITLLRVFGAKNGPQKKMTPEEAARRQAEINRQRREKYGNDG